MACIPVAPLPLSMQKAADIDEATMALVCPPTRSNSRAHGAAGELPPIAGSPLFRMRSWQM